MAFLTFLSDDNGVGNKVFMTVSAMTMASLLLSERTRIFVGSHLARWRVKLLAVEVSKTDGDSVDVPKVSGVFVYPVKSLHAVSVKKAKIDSLGLEGDRRLMLVRPSPPPMIGTFGPNDATHRFFTQRQCPSLVTIDASLPVAADESGNIVVRLTSRMLPNKQVSIDISDNALKSDATRYRAGIWGDVVKVADAGDEAAEFVRDVLTRCHEPFDDVRVVTMVPDTVREADGKYVPLAAMTNLGLTPRVALSDGFPILIACESSLTELNMRLKARGKDPVPMSRFRPNIVIQNTKPFEEDTWKVVKVGSLILHVVKGCPRCKQSCTDQETGKTSEEPLETLAEFRALGHNKEDVYFAQNALFQGSGGVINVGDAVKILTRGDPVWDKDPVQAE